MENIFNDGFGSVTQETFDTLMKALSAGDYDVAPTSLTQGAALQVESLDASLKAVTFSDKHLKFFPALPKDKAYNLLEEYNRQTSYGESSNGLFFDANSGTAPLEKTAAYNRQAQEVKYMGKTTVVTHPLTLVKPAHGPIVAKEIKNATMIMLQNLERQLFEANGFFQDGATGVFDGDPADVPAASAKFNGMEQQIRFGESDTKAKYTGWEAYGNTNTVSEDLAGGGLDEEAIENLAVKVVENMGTPESAYFDPKRHSDLSKTFYEKERAMLGSAGGAAGVIIKSMLTSAGSISIENSIFLRPKDAPLSVAQTGAPATPAVTSTGVESDASSTLQATTYHYRVSALNNEGESLAAADEDQVVAAGERAVITITAGTAGALYYAVYRSLSATGHKFIGYVKDSSAGGGGGAVFRDKGVRQPGASTGYLFSMNADDICWKQLAPLMKMDLAVTGPAYRFMTLLYGTPIVFAPLHHGMWDNIGRG